MDQKFAERLTALRKNAGYSQEELADTIGVSRQAVSKWERGESSPDTDNLIELARLYHISLDEMVNGNALPAKEIADAEKAPEKSQAYTWGDDGMVVEVSEAEVSVMNEDGEKKVYDKEELRRKRLKEKRVNVVITSIIALLSVITYLLLGFLLEGGKGWTCAWPLFLLIPVVSSIVGLFYYKRLAAFAYPPLIVAVYCTIGMIWGIWHPTWVMFITIPVYYIIADKVDRLTRTRDYEAIDDAMTGKKRK